jgi:hypothetical protein
MAASETVCPDVSGQLLGGILQATLCLLIARSPTAHRSPITAQRQPTTAHRLLPTDHRFFAGSRRVASLMRRQNSFLVTSWEVPSLVRRSAICLYSMARRSHLTINR